MQADFYYKMNKLNLVLSLFSSTNCLNLNSTHYNNVYFFRIFVCCWEEQILFSLLLMLRLLFFMH